jgi:hypothetical protein
MDRDILDVSYKDAEQCSRSFVSNSDKYSNDKLNCGWRGHIWSSGPGKIV